MMLRHGFGLMNEAHAIEAAVGMAFERGARTRDLVDRDDDAHLTCSGMARYVADAIASTTPARTA
jgi:isocitrate/isopropylmalate dehydrogenase